MINAVSGVGFSGVGAVKECNPADKCQNTNLLKQNSAGDSVSFSGKEGKMSDDEKKELILKARTKAAGYAFWGNGFSVLYYGLRSDDKIARKYNLDLIEDKKLIKQNKKEQFLWTLPSVIPGFQFIGGGAAYLYNKCVASAEDIPPQYTKIVAGLLFNAKS